MQSLKVSNFDIHQKVGISLVLMLSVIFYSCNEKIFDNEKELMDYIQDESNGYIHHKTVNGIDFSLMYRPTDLLVKQDIGNEEVTKVTLKELKDKYEKYIYFNLSMSKNNKELLSIVPKNDSHYKSLSNLLTFDMGKNIFLYTKAKDTIEMLDYLYPKMYGATNATSMLFVFDRDDIESEDLSFSIRDFGLGVGDIKFKIKNSKIKNEPRLTFK